MDKEKSTIIVDEDDILKFSEKIKQNARENEKFSLLLEKFLNGKKKADSLLYIGKTSNALYVAGAKQNLDVVIASKTIVKCMSESTEHYHGHGLDKEIMLQLPQELRNPVMIFKGSVDNSLVAITQLKDKENREIMVAVSLSEKDKFREVNRISSAYGRNNMINYLRRQMSVGNLIAANKQKAERMLHSAGLQLPMENTFISFDNSISYSTQNVNISKVNSDIALSQNQVQNDNPAFLAEEQQSVVSEQLVSTAEQPTPEPIEPEIAEPIIEPMDMDFGFDMNM